MQISPGTQLGAYRIVAPLGTGGMGEVYRARHDDLDRDVAIKTLPARLRSEPAALARFEREAKVLAGLSHPNVLAIFDFVHLPGNGDGQGGMAFAVTELLEGRSLRARLEEGGVPLRKAVDWAAQAARGLAAAHDKGITHRDLKPDNLFVTNDGIVKVLDFGLARQGWTMAGASNGEADGGPTLSRLTEPGTVMGTVGYMSPEQVRGREADARSDIFSLGAVIYELLSGRRAFQRDTAAETLTAILKEEPPELTQTQPALPLGLERIVRHCLEKRAEERFQSARDLAFDLQSFADATSWPSGVRRLLPIGRATWRRALRGAAVLALVAAAFAAGRGLAPARGPAGVLPQHFTLLTDRPGLESKPSLSPDGSLVAFVSETEGQRDVYVQRVGGRNPINVTKDPADDSAPAFSPDGQRIAFRSSRAGGGIFVMGATGESVRRLTDFGHDPAWSPDGRTLAVAGEAVEDPRGRSGKASALWLVDADTGRSRKLFDGDAVQPSFSPSGRRIAFWAVPEGTGQRDLWTIAVTEDGGARPVQVTDDAALDWNPVWARDGRALYFASDRGGTMNLWRVAVNEKTGRVRGAPEAFTVPAPAAGYLSLSADGRLLAYAGAHAQTRLFRAAFDPQRGKLAGALEPFLELSREFWMPDAAPDGSAVALTSMGPREDLYVIDADGRGFTQLTDDEFRDRGPRLSPDGRHIAFYSNRGGRYGLWLIGRDGSGLRRLSTPEQTVIGPAVWSPDGRRLAVPGQPPVIFTLGDDGSVTSTPLPPVADGILFEPMMWLGDELTGAGGKADADHAPGLYTYAPARGEYRKVADVPHDTKYNWIASLDARRMLIEREGELLVIDMSSQAVSSAGKVRSGTRQTAHWSLSRDGRTLVLLERAVDSDVWIAELR